MKAKENICIIIVSLFLSLILASVPFSNQNSPFDEIVMLCKNYQVDNIGFHTRTIYLSDYTYILKYNPKENVIAISKSKKFEMVIIFKSFDSYYVAISEDIRRSDRDFTKKVGSELANELAADILKEIKGVTI